MGNIAHSQFDGPLHSSVYCLNPTNNIGAFVSTKSLSFPEDMASKAENLKAFSGIKVRHVRSELEKMLSLIGRSEIFDEYTLHDITHVDAMLDSLRWIIPEETSAALTPADWLLIVFSIYLHDLGLLVTKSEYAARERSGFRRFCDDVLFAEREGEDYRARVFRQYPDADDRERFLYQEFVRHNHAIRIRHWITGRATTEFGVTSEIPAEMERLLGMLDPKFRHDLGLVCESHHLSDLGDLSKYRPSVPYGNAPAEAANLQYAAIVLRTADLLHITSDRTPSVMFRLINPANPKSQVEWAKQRGVTTVRPQLGLDKDGNPHPDAPRSIIEVHASFTDAEAFFGITSYLKYASDQLGKSAEWTQITQKRGYPQYSFPWRGIDDSFVEASGFLPKPFAFAIDQRKILDLLTGHTLYNDTGVVLRELVQNALDAVRLQAVADGVGATVGKVHVHWDPSTRRLSVSDNGTGMTQEIIEKFFLNAGSSRYQDPEFKRRFPNFSPISRFGIGILSCFMIADEVEVTTCHPEEPEARSLSLRSVHGRYLIRLLEKTAPEVAALCPHGTTVTLALRPSAGTMDVLRILRQWVVIPGCEVTVSSDAEHVTVGYESPGAALRRVLADAGYQIQDGVPETPDDELTGRSVRIVEASLGNVALAYAVHWSSFFREWSFLTWSHNDLVRPRDEDWSFGFCVEGIRVQGGTPGYHGTPIAAIANASGQNAPRTNVARSRLEDTPELQSTLSLIYQMYAAHVKQELDDLHGARGFSLTWATREGIFLLNPLFRTPSLASQLLDDATSQLPLYLVEQSGKRRAISAVELRNENEFWTSESALLRSAEELIREAPGAASVQSLLAALSSPDLQYPDGIYLATTYVKSTLHEAVFRGKEVVEIRGMPNQRRLDVRWGAKSQPSRWRRFPPRIWEDIHDRYSSIFERATANRRDSVMNLFVARGDLAVTGIGQAIGVRAHGNTFLIPDSPIASHLNDLLDSLTKQITSEDERLAAAVMFQLTQRFLDVRAAEIEPETVREHIGRMNPRFLDGSWIPAFAKALQDSRMVVYDPAAWRRSAIE